MTRYSKTMSEALQEVSERASAKRDAMKAMGKNKGIDPADVDTDATDDDVKAASKNIIMQLRKSVSMRGNHNVEFASGKQKVDAKIAQAVQDKFNKIKRSADKQDFQNKIAKSYKDLLIALKEQYEMVEVKEEYVCEDCGCEQGNADPKCDCPNDSTDLQASYWVKKESVDEEVDLGEMKEPFVVVDTADGNKVVATASDEKGAKSSIASAELPPMKIKDKKTLKIVKVKKKQMIGQPIKEEVDLGEGMKMNDPKLLKMFDKLKKGSKIKLKTSSTISQGKDYVEYIVKSKNTVNKGRVEKITLATVGNEGAVKKFLYKRDGTVGFAIGDMGASIDDIKEDFTPHMMYDPKTGKGYKAEKEADHLRMKDMGYTHEKPDMKEEEGEDNRPDSAKEVDAGREDKKKTRIAQLQLQIAKATETINKLNTQEK
jgi:hypothetical protein